MALWPVGLTWGNYQKILSAGPVYRALFVTVERVVLGTTVNMALTILAAYPLSRSAQEFKGRNWFMVYPFLQRYFIHGIRLGAVKG